MEPTTSFSQDGHLEPATDFPYDEVDRGNPLAAELERPDAYREAALNWQKFDDRQDGILVSLKILQVDCLLFVKQKFSLIGTDDQVELARRYNCKKQNVSKYVRAYQRQLNLSDLASRKDTRRMRKRRRAQVKEPKKS